MGFQYFKRQLQAPGYNLARGLPAEATTAVNMDLLFAAATNGVKEGRLVRLDSAGKIRPTTGTSGRASLGVSLTSGSSGSNVQVRVFGIAPAVASTAAMALGAYVRANAGASTSSSAGTARTSTNTTGGFGIRATAIGIALTSVAAGAISGTRTVNLLLLHPGQVLI